MLNINLTSTQKTDRYKELAQQFAALLKNENDWIANCAQLSSVIFHAFPSCLNWAGFYYYKNNQLILGPFQGKPACVRIPMGKGVCGLAAQKRETILAADVHALDNYIACDDVTRSEIVVPMIKDQQLLGVLDLDSPLLNNFDEDDKKGLEKLVDILLSNSKINFY